MDERDSGIAETAAPKEAAPAAAPPDIASAVEAWWNDHFPGSPVARVTEAWNHAHAAKEELKRRLATLLNGGQ